MRRIPPLLAAAALLLGLASLPRSLTSRVAVAPDFVHFESAHVHPAVLTPSGDRLLVVNTPDNRLSVFSLEGPAPVLIAEIPVGLEPVSVACRSDGEAWVVNHLSDDVSIVDLSTLNTRATLRVGDEPSDVVFAGGNGFNPGDAFVSVSQEDAIKVYDPAHLANAPAVIPIPGRMPRALARTADGTKVYAALFDGGNRTSVLSEAEAGDSLPSPSPPLRQGLPPAPHVGLIIQQQSGHWRDESGKLWDAKAKYSTYEVDVAEITAATDSVSRGFGDLGAVSFALAVSPTDGRIGVTTTEARNFTRFEPNLRGHLVDTRAAWITQAGTATLSNLNPHINYSVTPGTQAERDSAVGIPSGAAWSANGQRFYVTSLASDRLAVLNPSLPNQVLARRPTVAGPTGVVVDDARGRLYVVGRFHNQLQTLSSADFSQVALTGIGFDPTPDAIVNGRKFFYGGFTSGHGEEACATCHVFGDFDNLAWDLGDPQGNLQPVNTAGQLDPLILANVHPMKGPMATQSLRGLGGTGMFHWRADRLNLDAFNGAFVSLLGRAVQLPDSEMAAFDDFVLPLVHPPNPNQFLDRSVRDAPVGSPSAQRGRNFFFNTQVDGNLTCNQCHAATSFGPGTNGQIIDRFALQEAQDMKVPQLRNLYRKTGFKDSVGVVNKRGFGFTHNGAVDNLFDFLKFPGFNFGQTQNIADANRRDVEAFLLAFDTGMTPAVGAQVTFDPSNRTDPPSIARMDTLEQQASQGYCDLIAKGRIDGEPRGWVFLGAGQWATDRQGVLPISSTALRALASTGGEITVTGVPAGSGERMGIDRDRDGFYDNDELRMGTDAADPASHPAATGVPTGTPAFGLRSIKPNPFRAAIEVAFSLGRPGPVDCVIYDLFGREVRSLARGKPFDAGPASLTWDGRRSDGGEAAAGVYFVRLRTSAGEWTRAVVRVR